MPARRVLVVGGGAAGYFGAITCAEEAPGTAVTLVEATAHTLAKVRISGGGRCNVTHACFDPRKLASHYPRGSRELIGPFTRFGPTDTAAWFAARAVPLMTEPDGRMFPQSNTSATVVDCLEKAAAKAGVVVRRNTPLRELRRAGDGFVARLGDGSEIAADRVLIATGGGKSGGGLAAAAALGHGIEEPVPSLFTFHIGDPFLKGLEGVSCEAQVSIEGTKLRETGPVLVTHWGLSGPAILRLSAWGARILHGLDYRFTLAVSFVQGRSAGQVDGALQAERRDHPQRKVSSSNPFGLPARIWERLLVAGGVPPDTLWSGLSNDLLRRLVQALTATRLGVEGKSMNKEEFVTCGGVRLSEVDMRTLESRVCPGLYFAGEVLDIDGITGGFNFQAAWTTAWHAGRAMARP
jgi:predicted Rossmann fold flavoprotein